ncbi:MAG: [protein-PII] uridylyltransferase family protein, partial [Acidimicrobiales bacterium]
SYASDLDVVFVYEGFSTADFAEAERAAEELLWFLGGEGGPARIRTLDLGLRPEGRQGPLARSLEGYRQYYERYVETWELQALVRARPVAGDQALGERFMELIEPYVWGEPLSEARAREIRRMKARIERERIPAGEDSQFHLKLGRGSLSDVEFTAQMLQLRHGVREPATLGGLEALASAGHLDPDDHRALSEAYRFCEHTRNRWYLVGSGRGGRPGPGLDSLPSSPGDLARLARSLGTGGPRLREDYRRVTRRCRAVVARLFYGAFYGAGPPVGPREI